MSAPLYHKANIVAELAERLADAVHGPDEDAEFLALQLDSEAQGLEALCLSALREARLAEAYGEALKSIEADNRARRQRLERRAETIRANVAWALQEAGIPKITAPDLTVSWRMGKPPLIIDGEPSEDDFVFGYATAKRSFAWDKTAIRQLVESEPDKWAFRFRLGNPVPQIVVRGK